LNEIATVRIELRHIEPLIWRQVEVPTSMTLKVLHEIIQAVMRWFDDQSWEFAVGEQRYGLDRDKEVGSGPRLLANKVRLRDVLKREMTIIDYTYDFNDNWEHRLTITDLRARLPGILYPRYSGGGKMAPPEDCGGISGFYEWLEMMSAPIDGGEAEPKEWGDGDAYTLDEPRIKNVIGRNANRHDAARARIAKNK
jgi:hypothetical protein